MQSKGWCVPLDGMFDRMQLRQHNRTIAFVIMKNQCKNVRTTSAMTAVWESIVLDEQFNQAHSPGWLKMGF